MPKQELNEEPDYHYMFPLGIAYISSVLKVAGHEVTCLNMYHQKGSVEEIMENVLSKKTYDFICTGGTVLHYLAIEKILHIAKKNGVKTIIGGMIINGEPETIFKMLEPNYAVLWEGEETVVELLDHIEKNEPLDTVKGIMFRNDGKLIITEKRKDITDLDSLPYPDLEGFEFEKLLDNTYSSSSFSYFNYPRLYSILGSRGCPFNCTFCYHYSKYRKRSIDDIINEMKFVIEEYKINTIEILDECLAIDKQRLFELCKRIKEVGDELNGQFAWIPQITVRDADDDILKAFKESRAIMVSYGFESFSPIVLKSMKKPITPEMISVAFEKTLKAGLAVQANFIFGDIAETKETSKETMDWWKQNSKGQINLAFIQPYPGSEIYKILMEKGRLGDKETFIQNIRNHPLYNLTNEMTDKDIQKLRRDLVNLERKYRKTTSFKSIKETGEKIHSFDVKCPYCKKITHYENFNFKDVNVKASRWNYQTKLTCRNCFMGFNAISPLRGFIYKYFPLIVLMKTKDAIRYISKKVKNVYS